MYFLLHGSYNICVYVGPHLGEFELKALSLEMHIIYLLANGNHMSKCSDFDLISEKICLLLN